MESHRKPPPGQMIIAVPFATEASGRYTLRVGRVTFAMRRVPSCGLLISVSSYFQVSEPGATPGQIGTTFASAPNVTAAARMGRILEIDFFMSRPGLYCRGRIRRDSSWK